MVDLWLFYAILVTQCKQDCKGKIWQKSNVTAKPGKGHAHNYNCGVRLWICQLDEVIFKVCSLMEVTREMLLHTRSTTPSHGINAKQIHMPR